MKKLIFFLFFLPIFAQSVADTEITPTNLQEAVFYSRNVYNNVVFVGDIDATSDRDGQKIQGAVNTITQAITVANSLAPSAVKQVTIFVVDGRIYNESVTLPDYVNLIGVGAIFQNITAGSTSSTIVELSDIGAITNWGDIQGTLSNQTDLQGALDGKQPISTLLTQIASLTPANLDIIQYRGSTYETRTPAQFKIDLALTKSDVGLDSLTNNLQVKRAAGSYTEFGQKSVVSVNDKVPIEDSENSNVKRYVTVSQITGAAGGEDNVLDTLTTNRGISPIANPSKTGVSLNLKKIVNGAGIDITTDDSTYTIAVTEVPGVVLLGSADITTTVSSVDIEWTNSDEYSKIVIVYLLKSGSTFSEFTDIQYKIGTSFITTGYSNSFRINMGSTYSTNSLSSTTQVKLCGMRGTKTIEIFTSDTDRIRMRENCFTDADTPTTFEYLTVNTSAITNSNNLTGVRFINGASNINNTDIRVYGYKK